MPESTAAARVKCPTCGLKYAPKPEHAGKRVKCKCGASFTMPKVEQAVKGATGGLSAGVPASDGITGRQAARGTRQATPKAPACPSCHQPLAAEAVICINCGFNRATGAAAATEVGRAFKTAHAVGVGRRSATVYYDTTFSGRWSRSWEFAKISYGIIWDFKRLLIFPILSGTAALLVAASFILPLWGTPQLDRWTSFLDGQEYVAEEQAPESAAATDAQEEGEADAAVALEDGGVTLRDNETAPTPPATEPAGTAQESGDGLFKDVLMYAWVFAFYFCDFFVIVFFNTALTACAMKVYSGGTPTVGYGLSVAIKRLPTILAWAFVSASVGLALKAVENVHEKLGKWIAAMIGTAWTVLTYFVVPVLVIEGIGPVPAVKKSFAVLRKTWGEGVLGNFSMGLFGTVLALPVLLVVAVFFAAAYTTHNPMFAVFGMLVGVLGMILLCAVNSAADTIFKALLYNYATGGTIPEEVDEQALVAAFGSKGN